MRWVCRSAYSISDIGPFELPWKTPQELVDAVHGPTPSDLWPLCRTFYRANGIEQHKPIMEDIEAGVRASNMVEIDFVYTIEGKEYKSKNWRFYTDED